MLDFVRETDKIDRPPPHDLSLHRVFKKDATTIRVVQLGALLALNLGRLSVSVRKLRAADDDPRSYALDRATAHSLSACKRCTHIVPDCLFPVRTQMPNEFADRGEFATVVQQFVGKIPDGVQRTAKSALVLPHRFEGLTEPP